jgi:hypothetical protein
MYEIDLRFVWPELPSHSVSGIRQGCDRKFKTYEKETKHHAITDA